MKITLIGAGCGTAATLTEQAREAIAQAQLVIGARRLLNGLRTENISPACRLAEAVYTKDIVSLIQEASCDRICVLLSGDSGFYSGTRLLLPALEEYDTEVLPGISSLQAFAARLGRPWQDWTLCSAHGVDCDVVAAVCGTAPVFFLTGGRMGPAELCRRLTEAGLARLPVTVGENLMCPDERIVSGTASQLAAQTFAPLSVMLAEPAHRLPRRTAGLPDELFRRTERIPMTKQEIRAAALAKLAVDPDDICWDIGAGTGSVSVELALQAKNVWAVERDPEALALAERNRAAFGAWNLRLIEGSAPDALKGLPAPDAVFVGGSGGRMGAILRAVYDANPGARICVAAIAL
ncbi:MAG: precorrin-6y C5,15-methyltransferase (decarboxylating) subunit CbiE, partial [Oscillospiraceae bacterium]|nr:precorrin-6y C5,15-methyltransferase (decarboxylating) subunit CbiE [Oscillospiraceae bacterium]